jgi:hypothetical protein
VLQTILRIGNGAIQSVACSDLPRKMTGKFYLNKSKRAPQRNRATDRGERLKIDQLQTVVNCLLVEARMQHDTSNPKQLYNPTVIPDALEPEAWLVVRVASLIMDDSWVAWTVAFM